MTTNDQEPSGIHAQRIQADNVVYGTQIQGGDPAKAAVLIQLAQAIKGGKISADDIKARNVVSGLQYIADPATASAEDLRKELISFQARLDSSNATTTSASSRI